MKGGKKMTAPTGVVVTVRPTGAASGGEQACDIDSPGNALNNAIFLDKATAYDVTFQLQGNPGFGFDTNNPFSNQNSRCPRNAGPVRAPCALKNPPAPTANSFTITVSPTAKGVTYYRLNFDNGTSCDPVIIHE